MIIRREGKTIFQKYGKYGLILLFSGIGLTYGNTLYHSYTDKAVCLICFVKNV